MKAKYLMLAMMAAVVSFGTMSCSSDDDTPTPNPINPVKTDVSNGLFVLGSGNTRAGIAGNLSYINYEKGVAVPGIFEAVNGKSIGRTSNKLLVYGSKLYIVVDRENTIWVTNKNTLVVERQLSTTSLLGETLGVSPRSVVGEGGNIYFTTYGGIVAAVDTVNFQLVKTYTAGSYPDGLTVANGFIYVANSDYGNGQNPSISKIDLAAGTTKELRGEAITNPMHMLTVGNTAYFLDYGTYDASWNQTGAGVRRINADDSVERILDGTAMCTDGQSIFTVDAPYGASGIKYLIYNTTTKAISEWTPVGIFSPAIIAADPVTGDIFIVSYQENPSTGYAGYALPSYTNQYKKDGSFVKKYTDTATGPIDAIFNVDTK